MKTICFFNNKGGVGKTVSITSVATIMTGVFNRKVLLVDLDPQANASSMFSKIKFTKIISNILNGVNDEQELTVADLLKDDNLDPTKVIKKTKYKNLDLIPSILNLANTESEMRNNILSPQQFKLKNQLKKIESMYDYCLIDCSPSIGLLNINALSAADMVYVPTRCDGGSAYGVMTTIQYIESIKNINSSLIMGGCFFTQFSDRRNIDKTAYALTEKVLKAKNKPLLDITIRQSKLMQENSILQKTILELDPDKKEKITQEYIQLTKHILMNYEKEILSQLELSI